MINFPAWVTAPKRVSRQTQAFKILRYLVIRASLESSFDASVVNFATNIGMERTTIHYYMKVGKFSNKSAQKAEAFYGKDLIKAEWLTDPLSLLKAV